MVYQTSCVFRFPVTTVTHRGGIHLWKTIFYLRVTKKKEEISRKSKDLKIYHIKVLLP